MMNNTELCYCLKAAQQDLLKEHTSELTASLCSKKNSSLITSIMDYNKGHDGMFMLIMTKQAMMQVHAHNEFCR